MPNIAVFIRDQLQEKPTDTTTLYEGWQNSRPRKGTRIYFNQMINRLKRLGWIQEVFSEEPIMEGFANLKTWELTDEGNAATFQQWQDPIGELYPKHASANRGRWKPTGNPPGRPRKVFSSPVIEEAPSEPTTPRRSRRSSAPSDLTLEQVQTAREETEDWAVRVGRSVEVRRALSNLGLKQWIEENLPYEATTESEERLKTRLIEVARGIIARMNS